MSQQEQDTELMDNFFPRVTKPGIQHAEVNDLYDKFAQQYDSWVSRNKYVVPKVGAETLAELLPRRTDAKILDVGAGTGLVGEQLFAKGYTNIDALDASAAMIEQAKAKGVYTRFICDYLGPNRLPIDDNTYDAITAVGCFVEGHVKLDCFEELFRITKSGSPIVITMAEKFLLNVEEYNDNKFDETLLRHEKNGLCKLRSRKFLPCLQLDGNYTVYHVETV